MEWMMEYLETAPSDHTAFIIMAFFCILHCYLYWVFAKWYSAPNTILLTGLSGSGKTVLYYQLRDGSFHEGTVASTKPNEGTFILHSEKSKRCKSYPVHIVDIPGHVLFRRKLDELLNQTAGLVFVVDAVEFVNKVPALSEYLYDILTKATVVKKKIPVLLLFNKADKATAHSESFITRQLEKEIDNILTSSPDLSSAGISNERIGIPGKAFAFSQCVNNVTVAVASGLTGNISQLEQFIRDYVKA